MTNNHENSGEEQYNHSGMMTFIFAMTFVLCFFLYLVFIHPGVDLKENLQAVKVATEGETPQAPAFDATKVAEPWIENADMVTYGKGVFAQNCAMCHGNEGHGDGPAGQALNPKPRNLVEGPWKKGGGYIGIFNVVKDGLPGTSMSAYGHLKLADRWALVQFINSITKAKVKEDPKKVAEFGKSAN